MSDIQLIKQRWLDAMSPIANSHEEFVAQVFSDFERIDAKYHELESAQYAQRQAERGLISKTTAEHEIARRGLVSLSSEPEGQQAANRTNSDTPPGLNSQ